MTVEVVVSLSLLTCHSMVNQSPHFSQPQHKTLKRDTLKLVPFGTRWQGKWEDTRVNSVSAFSPLT